MTLTVHNPVAPLGAYSSGISTPAGGRWLHISGQVGIGADGQLAEGFEAQADTAWRNLVAVLGDAGMTVADLVKVTHFLVRAEDLPAYNPVRLRHLGNARPASTLLFVAGLARPEWRIEVEATAWRA